MKIYIEHMTITTEDKATTMQDALASAIMDFAQSQQPLQDDADEEDEKALFAGSATSDSDVVDDYNRALVRKQDEKYSHSKFWLLAKSLWRVTDNIGFLSYCDQLSKAVADGELITKLSKQGNPLYMTP